MPFDPTYFNQPIPGSVDPSNGFVWGTPQWTAARSKSDAAMYAAMPHNGTLVSGQVGPTPWEQQTSASPAPSSTPTYSSPLPAYNLGSTQTANTLAPGSRQTPLTSQQPSNLNSLISQLMQSNFGLGGSGTGSSLTGSPAGGSAPAQNFYTPKIGAFYS